MSAIQIVTNYKQVPDSSMILLVEGIVQRLTGNPYFNIPPERLGKFNTLKEDFQVNLGKSQGGSKVDTLNKNRSKLDLALFMEDLALDLNIQVKGDREKLATTGFTLVKEPERHKQPGKPTGFAISYGVSSGEVVLSVDSCSDSKFYLFCYTIDPPAEAHPSNWKSVASTSRKVLVEGLTRGAEYQFCCAYQGTDGKPIYCDPVKVLML